MASEMGMSLDAIRYLTLTQIRYFQLGIIKHRAEMAEMLSMAMRASVMTEKDVFEQWMGSLGNMGQEFTAALSAPSREKSEDFDWKQDEKTGVVGSNKNKDFFDHYFDKNKPKKEESKEELI